MDEHATNSWVGRTLGGRYEILEAIGEGGMGVVYRAKQISVDREVAIKMMHARAAQDPQWGERFQSEAKACSMLTHPNTIRLYDFGQTTLGNFYMVMELLQGRSLSDVIQHEAPMDAARVLRIMMQCCASLGEAHKVGVIHRDIKPDNIFLLELEGAKDFVKLFDFSIAKRSDVAMTATGIIMGTPQFMSPEQGRGENIDLRSDLYSLGVLAYAMLSGRLPFHDADPIEVLRMHQSVPVPPLPETVPDSVRKVVMSCLDKNPSRRPASALSLLEACKIWLTKLDPTLDVASDPVLRNTLVSDEPPVPVSPSGSTFPRASTNAKTMLGTSASIRKAPERGAGPREAKTVMRDNQAQAPDPDVHQKKTVVRPSGTHDARRLVNSDNAKTMISPSGSHEAKTMINTGSNSSSDNAKTMISPSGTHQTFEARTMIKDERAETKDQTGQRKSQSKSMMATMIHSPGGGVPKEQQPQPVDRSLPLKAPADPNRGSSARAAAVRSSQKIQPQQAYPQAPAPDLRSQVSPIGPAMQFPPQAEPPMMPRTGTAGFLFICLLVALTFGFGGYFLAATLR